jgi:hypothetical protein
MSITRGCLLVLGPCLVGSLTGAVALRLVSLRDQRGRIWLYAGTSEYLVVLVQFILSSENLSSADNQQERSS